MSACTGGTSQAIQARQAVIFREAAQREAASNQGIVHISDCRYMDSVDSSRVANSKIPTAKSPTLLYGPVGSHPCPLVSQCTKLPLMLDPTLHRSSTPAEIATVKRRAAPKLFRTRRLANGQLVRTRAGPAVEAKAREIRENIAESRRHRGSVGNLYSAGSSENWSPAPNTPAYASSSLPSAPMAPMEYEGMPHMNSLTFSEQNRLADITEGVASQDFSTPYDNEDRRDSTMTLCDTGPTLFQPSLPYTFGQVQIVSDTQPQVQQMHQAPALPAHMQLQMPPAVSQQGRLFQSCPASIHTTPIPSHMTLEQINRGAFSNPLAYQASAKESSVIQANPGINRIAAPAAPPPFTRDQTHGTVHVGSFPLSPSSGTPSSLVSWTKTPVNGTPQVIAHSFENSLSQQQNSLASVAQTPCHSHQESWESRTTPLSPHPPGTIDPRWISPLSSLWSTPAATPRTGSPISRIVGAGMPASYAAPPSQSLDLDLIQHTRVFGTQTYPPGSGDRRLGDSPPLPIYNHDGQEANRCGVDGMEREIKQDGEYADADKAVPFHLMTAGIGGARWFQ